MQQSQPRTLSEVLDDTLSELTTDTVTLRQISEQLGTRSYGAFIVFMSLPSFVPGISIISGLLVLLFSLQMFLGIQKPWLPKFIAEFAINTSTLRKAMAYLRPKLIKFEDLIRPRFVFMSTGLAIRAMGAVIAFLSLMVLFPLPFSNLVPSLALLILAIGMLQKDGLTALLSIVFGLTYSAIFLWFVWSLIIRIFAIL
ncbi:MAG: exopolysaccharide biosynthesis protein [Kangiellaceae bacterium]|jgi:hypothetical protein|nr:exopolysaccharide biosynthesis protein [Kangiellaceae bacterium]